MFEIPPKIYFGSHRESYYVDVVRVGKGFVEVLVEGLKLGAGWGRAGFKGLSCDVGSREERGEDDEEGHGG